MKTQSASLLRLTSLPRRAIVFALCVGFAVLSVAAQAALNDADDPRALFREANQAYSSGEYAQARDLYLRLLTVVPKNPTVEFNLGDAYARLNDTARAILHYERALRSDPRFDDARTNILRLAPPANNPEVSPLIAPLRWVKHRMNADEWVWLSFFLFFALCLWASLWTLEMKPRPLWKHMTGVFSVLLVLSICFAVPAVSDALRREGIVLQDKTLARSGPGDNYREAMELPAGAKIAAVGEPQRGWVKIRTPDGLVAFIQSAGVEWI